MSEPITQADIDAVVADLEHFRRTHVDWAQHFEQHPEIAARYVASGEWDDAAEHRRIVDVYDRAIQIIRMAATPSLAEQATTQ